MNESAKKKLKQSRLPFSILTAELEKKSTTPEDNTPSKANVPSRKRKPSNDAEDSKLTKIGRVADSKENILTKNDVIEIEEDSNKNGINDKEVVTDDQSHINYPETTPKASTSSESVLHIKLTSCTKSKRKINMDVKPHKPIDEEDSVVYLDNEEIPKSNKKSKKSAKKSEKKNYKKKTSGSNRARKTLNMSGPAEDKSAISEAIALSSGGEKGSGESSKKNEDKSDAAPIEFDKPLAEKLTKPCNETTKDEIAPMDQIKTIPSNASSPQPEDPDVIHEEIAEVLSDDSEANKISAISPDDSGVRKTPTSVKVDLKNLTPKQLARRQEQEARRLEKEMQRQKERDLKEQQRLKEKEQREEAKRKEKEEKEEARRQEKEERERKRQAEQDKKDEEKRQKEEERKRVADQREEEKRHREEERKRQVELREEEKRKRDEAQKRKEAEEESRKKRAAEAFSKFFVPKKKTDTTTAEDETSKDSAESIEAFGIVKSNFMPFQIRERMKVAPCVRLQIDKEQLKILDDSLKTVKPLNELYLSKLKIGLHKPGTSVNTWTVEDKDEYEDVIVMDELEGVGEDIQTDESEMKMKQRAKYLMFVENRRPAYHGTWTKKTLKISGRRPFAQDPKFFDYEVDSDDEWEEEEPGESLHGSDSEKEKEAEEEYEVDNDFFVPHGHLSDEEMQQMDDDIHEDNSPETQKAKLKILQQEFAAEMKKKTEKIKPRLIGCIWMNGDEDENGCSKIGSMDKKYHCSDIIWRILKAREMMTTDDGVKLEDDLEPEITETEEEGEKAPPKIQVRAKFNEGSVKELMKLVHGNINNKRFIIKEFQAYRLKNFHKDPDFQEFSIKSVEEKMMEISEYKTCPEEGSMFGKKCWLVKQEALIEHHGEKKLPLPNEWTYILEKEVKERKPRQSTDPTRKEESPDKIQSEVQQRPADEKPIQRSPVSAVKKLLPHEPLVSSLKRPQSSPLNVPKKRVQLLISVPPGQEISQSKKNNLISQYLKGKEAAAGSKLSNVDDDVVLID